MAGWLQKIKLEGAHVQLIPLEKSHHKLLLGAASDGNLWDLWYTSVPDQSSVNAYIDKALLEHEQDKSLPFAIVDKASDKIVGSTRYMNAFAQHRRLEIGSTWYAKSVQRTGINTECKYLLLQHAFEKLNCIAVEFRTHWFNTDSRNAILRLGAKQDGVIRNHQINPDGSFRDTVVFSILESEWPAVKKGLEYNMKKAR